MKTLIDTIPSTKARQSFSAIITNAKINPIAISKKNKNIAVILSFKRYKELIKLEDVLYGKAAQLAIKE
jgi:prevent-host-death family protein